MKKLTDRCEPDGIGCIHPDAHRSIETDRCTKPSTASAHVRRDRNVKSSGLRGMRGAKLQYEVINSLQIACHYVFVLRLFARGFLSAWDSIEMLESIEEGDVA